MKIRILRKITIEVTAEGVLDKMWQLAFGWLPLLFPSPRDERGRYNKFHQFNIVLPFKRQTAEALALVVIGIVGGVYFGIIANRGYSQPQRQLPVTAPISAPIKKQYYSHSVPTQLRIPAVSVNTSLIELGKNADNTMQTPEQYEVAGWYKYSPTPGELGPTVIVGHVDNYKGPAVFWGLKQLKAGDIVEVERTDKKIVKFQVESIKQFPQSNFPTQEVYGNIDHAALRLITCGGVFNHQTQGYTDNIVVFANMVEG